MQEAAAAKKDIGTQSTFHIVSIDGGKTLNAELPLPRLFVLCLPQMMFPY
jgi:hypothetical protein